MATTSFLYHTLGLVGYQHLRTEFRDGEVYHHVELKPHCRRCRNCGARWLDLTLSGAFERAFRALPIGPRRQFVVLHGHRQHCGRCGKDLREPIRFASGKARHLKRFERYVVELCQIAPIKAVARCLGVGWDLVKDIYKAYLRRRLKKRKLAKVRYIAVDEFAVRKGHHYMTVVLDLSTGAILHAQEGKDAAALIPFLKKLRSARAPLQAVAIDMSEAYRKAVREVFGEALDIVHDPYHVVALVNEAIDETRRDLVRELEPERGDALKGSRYVLLRGFERLSDNGRQHLLRLMAANLPLYELYLLKETLRVFWRLPNATQAALFLDAWIVVAKASISEHFQRLATTLHEHRAGLLAYFRHPITTGPLEGINNKIKVLKRQAYGFRDMEYFKLRLLFLHESNYAFAG